MDVADDCSLWGDCLTWVPFLFIHHSPSDLAFPKTYIYMCVFFGIFSSGFLHSDLKMTLNLIWWRSKDFGFEISDPKNLCVYFSGSFIGFFAVWPSNDLEFDMMEINGPRIQNQRPQKPIYVFFWIFSIGFFSQKHCIEAVNFSILKRVFGVNRGNEDGLFRVESTSYC